MKPILYIVAIVFAFGAAFFSINQSRKFKALEEDRQATIVAKGQTEADLAVADKDIKEEKKKLVESQEKQELLTQSVSSLTSAGGAQARELAKLNEEIKAQEDEIAALEKPLAELKTMLASFGGDVTPDNLAEKVQQVENDKRAKQTKFEELEVLIIGAEKSLATTRAELDRLTKRIIDRNSRISRNSIGAVVTAVNQDWGFLVIGAGSNSGFTPQTPLLVERDGKMIGRVRPSSVEATQTIAEIDLESLASGVRLQPGDRVILAQPLAN